MSKHTPGPWRIGMLQNEKMDAPKGLTAKQRVEWDRIQADMNKPFRHNDGSFVVIKGSGDDRGPVATAVFQGSAKRGKAYDAPDPEGFANARLIAAAPEILAALERLRGCIQQTRGTDANEAVHQADEAIKKAKGEA